MIALSPEEHLFLVREVVKTIQPFLPKSVSEEDLCSAGTVGLLTAFKRFIPGREASFKTYCLIKIKGAIWDELRAMDCLRPTTRRKIAKLQTLLDSFPDISLKEVAQSLDISPGEVLKRERILLNARVFSLSKTSLEEGRPVAIGDRTSAEPVTVLEKREMIERVQRLVKRLPKRESLLIMLYYFEGLSMKQIARVVGVSLSRVSQMHSDVLARLRIMLKIKKREREVIVKSSKSNKEKEREHGKRKKSLPAPETD